jgi:hypothetical protein
MTEEDRAFIAPEDGEESDEESGKRGKKRKHDNDSGDDDDDDGGEIAEDVQAAMEAVGSKSSKGKKKDDEKKPKKKSGPRTCFWCDRPIDKGWITLRGQLTGTGNANVFFHDQCTEPYLLETKKARAEGKKPVPTKGKKSSKKVRACVCVVAGVIFSFLPG